MRTGVRVAHGLNLRTGLVTTETALPEMRARWRQPVFTASTPWRPGSEYCPVYSVCKFDVTSADFIVNDPSHAVLFRPS